MTHGQSCEMAVRDDGCCLEILISRLVGDEDYYNLSEHCHNNEYVIMVFHRGSCIGLGSRYLQAKSNG